MKVELITSPTEATWMGVKNRALVTAGKKAINPPDTQWKKRILEARHSPIRHLMFSFYIEEIPSWVATHLARHIHAQPYIKSCRNDRQNDFDRNTAPQNTPVNMIYDVNAEELMTIANKRLCGCASKETQQVVQMMCDEAIKVCPEIKEFLVPMCVHHGGVCHEMYPCGKSAAWFERGGIV